MSLFAFACGHVLGPAPPEEPYDQEDLDHPYCDSCQVQQTLNQDRKTEECRMLFENWGRSKCSIQNQNNLEAQLADDFSNSVTDATNLRGGDANYQAKFNLPQSLPLYPKVRQFKTTSPRRRHCCFPSPLLVTKPSPKLSLSARADTSASGQFDIGSEKSSDKKRSHNVQTLKNDQDGKIDQDGKTNHSERGIQRTENENSHKVYKDHMDEHELIVRNDRYIENGKSDENSQRHEHELTDGNSHNEKAFTKVSPVQNRFSRTGDLFGDDDMPLGLQMFLLRKGWPRDILWDQ